MNEPIVSPDSLDAAWAEAETALPEGWRISGLELGEFPENTAHVWRVFVDTTPEHDLEYAHAEWDADGPTPGAALRALAVKLRGRS